MMTTAEHLNSLTDRSKFETIANAFLRERYPGLAGLITNGLNNKGETIKGKPDSFTSIDNNHFVLVEHTTTDSNLEKKWLYDKTTYRGRKEKSAIKNGDLVDAIEQAENIRALIPAATFTVYLTTNGPVDHTLWLKAKAIGNKGNVSVDITDLSAIAHFLDTNPTGQYLRKIYLNIEQDLLSAELLQELQTRNLEQYRRDSFVDAESVIDHWQLKDVEKLVLSSDKLLNLIVADSGMGKTTLAFTMLKNQLLSGYNTLWVTPELITNALDPVRLVEQALKILHQKLFFNETSKTLLTGQQMLIVVDDINKSANPLGILNKLISWGMGPENEDYQNFKFICPVWPRFFFEITELEKKNEAFNYIELQRPSAAASGMLIEKGLEAAGKTLTVAEINLLAEMNGDDPLLMALNVQLVKKRGQYVANQAKEVIGTFISEKMAEALREMQIPSFKQQLLLSEFGKAMIKQRKVHPAYADIVKWFGPSGDVVSLIDKLGFQQELFLMKDDGKLQFRHDRIRNHIISAGFKTLIGNVADNIAALSEPFFAEMLALALVEKPVTRDDLSLVIGMNPEAIFEMLKYLQGDDEAAYFETTLSVIDDWKNDPAFPVYNTEILHSINWILLYTDTKAISRICNKFPNDRILNLAMLRNGNAVGGINFLLSFSDFEPFAGNNLRDMIVAHAKIRHFSRLRASFVKIIGEHLNLHSKVKPGVYLLAGYLKITGLAREMRLMWQADNDPDLFIYYLWAMINCANDGEIAELRVCFDHFDSLLESKADNDHYTKRAKNRIGYWFSKCRWSFTEEQIVLLNSLYDEYPYLISSFFGMIDHPLAILRTVHMLGNKLHHLDRPEGFDLNNQDRWDYKRNKYRLSEASLDVLTTAWRDRSNVDGVRKLAFRFWSDNQVKPKVVELCREITLKDRLLFEKAVLKRVELGDVTAADAFFPLIRKRRHHMNLLPYIWNDECKHFYNSFVREMADRFGNEEFSYDYIQFLIDLPPSEAEDVLKTNWDIFKHDPFAIQSALYLATPDMVRAAADYIQTYNDPKALFKHIDFLYHFIDANNYSITLLQLSALETYLKYFDEHSLRWLSEYCLKAGYKAWAIAHVYAHLTPENKVYLNPTKEDMMIEMQMFKKGDPRFMASNLLDSFRRRAVTRVDAISALEQFSLDDKSPEALKLLAYCLIQTGNRGDLKLLSNYDGVEMPGLNKQQLYQSVEYAVRKRSAI